MNKIKCHIRRLLSNSGLPETNPLLDFSDSMEEDFQKMLNDWESHMGSLPSSVR